MWYRSPELLFGAQQYGHGVDVWAAGCLLAELLPRQQTHSSSHQHRAALFPGSSELNQLQKIFELIGTPSESIWKEAVNFPNFQRFTYLPPDHSWVRDMFAASIDAAPDTDKVLISMLSLDPNHRPSAQALLDSPYLSELGPRPCAEQALAKQVLAFVGKHKE